MHIARRAFILTFHLKAILSQELKKEDVFAASSNILHMCENETEKKGNNQPRITKMNLKLDSKNSKDKQPLTNRG